MLRACQRRAALLLAGVAVAGSLAAWIRPEAVLPVVLAALIASAVWLMGELSRLIRASADLEEATQALRKRFHDLAEAVANSSEGVARVDDDGRLVWLNPAYAAMLGHEPDELVGMSSETGVHPDDLERVRKTYEALRVSGLASVIDVRAVARNDDILYTRVMIVRLPDSDAQPGYYTFVQDLSEEKEIEAALDRRGRELERLNTELEQFAYVAAHDLQEPARKVLSFASLLEQDFEDALPEAAARDLHFITDAARRMQQLVTDLLALSRAGRTALQPEIIEIDECVDAALDALVIKIEETGAEIVRDPLPTLEGDLTLLTQLYQNLLSNALKFCDEEHPEVYLTADLTSGCLVLGVRDNGIGIEPQYARQIFQPFKRLHGRSEYEGTGIGLAVCQKAVERHQGEIWVESESGKGSHFRFTIGECRR
jgi:PAS domain S-box-containing protein